MLNRIVHVTPLERYRLHVEFDDGVYGTIDLSNRLFGEMFEPLRDEAIFRQVSIDAHGVVCWPNGADLAPDAIHRALIRQRFPSIVGHRSSSVHASIKSHADCLEQLLQAVTDIDRDDNRQAAERLARVQEWIIRQTERAPEKPVLRNGRRVST